MARAKAKRKQGARKSAKRRRRAVANQPPVVAAVSVDAVRAVMVRMEVPETDAYPVELLDAVGLGIAFHDTAQGWDQWKGLGTRDGVRKVYQEQARRALDALRKYIAAHRK